MAGGRKRVLVVEDEALIAMLLERQLVALGLEVAAKLATGEAAVAEAPGLAPDLVFMDIRLAGEMDGLEAARRIAAALPEASIVFMTAYGTPEIKAEAALIPHLAFLEKPLSKEAVAGALGLG